MRPAEFDGVPKLQRLREAALVKEYTEVRRDGPNESPAHANAKRYR